MKRLAVAAVVLAAFAAGLLVAVPSDVLVAHVRARLPPAAARAVERVGSARLGVGGLTLREVSLRPHPGGPPVTLDPVSLRPSLLGLLAARGGRPWHVRARACGGEWQADVDRAPRGDTVALHFTSVDLATCLAPFERAATVTGTARGDADLVLASEVVSGRGRVALDAARWVPRSLPPSLVPEADRAAWRWELRERTLHVDDFAMTSRMLAASGGGRLHFPSPDGTPEMDFRIRVQPSPAMPQAHRDLLRKLPGSPPDAEGGRTYRIGGPLDAPVLGMP